MTTDRGNGRPFGRPFYVGVCLFPACQGGAYSSGSGTGAARPWRYSWFRIRLAALRSLALSSVSPSFRTFSGSVEAANRPGGGAVFTVRWPWKGGESL